MHVVHEAPVFPYCIIIIPQYNVEETTACSLLKQFPFKASIFHHGLLPANSATQDPHADFSGPSIHPSTFHRPRRHCALRTAHRPKRKLGPTNTRGVLASHHGSSNGATRRAPGELPGGPVASCRREFCRYIASEASTFNHIHPSFCMPIQRPHNTASELTKWAV